MELKVGMYVRTKCGYICELININDFREPTMRYAVEASYLKDIMFIGDEDISKASHNIIELLEEKDLLEIEYFSLRYEKRVTRLFEVTFKDERYINLDNAKCQFMLIDNDWSNSDKKLEPIIKSIVTKEQFSQISYNLPKDK